MLSLYNTLTRRKEVFTPLSPGVVTMYNCGPTVYNYAHIGNLRGYVNANLLYRVLEHQGFEVRQVINITDVGHLTDDADEGEDKIEKGAEREKKTVEEVIDFYTTAFLKDLKALGINTEEIYKFPRASKHIKEQVELIERLEKKGYTYRVSDGIYFDTSKFEDYGTLANLDIEGMKEGARVEINPEKRNITDFALWKFSNSDEQRAQEWDSPWGIGFPGWHLECSAMAMKYLGETIDIHTGGIDHIPVHHTNEIAQSVAATDRIFSRFWLHHEFVNISDGNKMSKSEDNFIRLETLKERGFAGLDYRYLLLLAHYRSPINFSFESLGSAARALSKLVHIYADLEEVNTANPSEKYNRQFFAALNDDLNSPAAIAVMWNMLKDEELYKEEKKATLVVFDSVLGLRLEMQSRSLRDIPADIMQLAQDRQKAKESKDYPRADEIRNKIDSLGYIIRDTAGGFEVEKK